MCAEGPPEDKFSVKVLLQMWNFMKLTLFTVQIVVCSIYVMISTLFSLVVLFEALVHGGNIREEQPTTSACLMIQTISATHLEFKGTAMCMEQSMRDHSQLFMTTMSPVLCAMLQQGWQSQWSQLKLSVHQHGLWSTLGTSCQKDFGVITTAPCMSVLTRTQTQCQVVFLVLMVLCFIMLKPTAVECCVHLMIHRKNLPVLFVPSRRHFLQ